LATAVVVSHLAARWRGSVRLAAEQAAEAGRLAEEQAALRRVATLVARGVAPTEVFDAVTAETKRLLAADATALFRYESDLSMRLVAHDLTSPVTLRVGGRLALAGDSAARRVLDSGRPARMERYVGVSGEIAEQQRQSGYRASAGAPIVVEGRLWGVMIATWSGTTPLAAGVEDRLAEFSEPIATAIANADSRGELQVLADEQAALRRVATLVARGAPPSAVFAAVG
jgi:GAF domain-containing protein